MLKKLLPVVLLAVVALGFGLRGPYFWPTSVALGPCLKDYTSPTSYSSRASPLRDVRMSFDSGSLLLCYGAPVARGRTIFGAGDALVPDGRLWRMGANEPTRLFSDVRIRLGDLELEPGRYSMYAVPDSATWKVFATRSTWHWGNQISASVRDQEIGSFEAIPRPGTPFADTLQFVGVAEGLEFGWGSLRVVLPVSEVSP